jgi:type IV fimbrial biogenesis protein FimT
MHDKKLRGLTAVELMVVLAILAILVSLATPAWQSFMARQKRDVLASQLTAHLALARSMAISRGRSVALSTLGDGWHSGWRVHLEMQRNGKWDFGEPVLANHTGDTQARMVGNGPLRRYVIFGSDGRPVQSNGSFLAGSIQICTPSNPEVIALVMSASGRIRQELRQSNCL